MAASELDQIISDRQRQRKARIVSFSFTAIGTPGEVAAQLGAVATDNLAGADAAALAARHIANDQPAPWAGHEIRYVVEASGHSGGGTALSLQLSIRGQWVKTPPRAAEPAAA